MSDTLWPREPHTAAKHLVLRAYIDGWLGVMANQALRIQRGNSPRPRLLLLDGFAGPGRYSGGEEGSPLIMLDALLEHRGFETWSGVDFDFLFIEHDGPRLAHLKSEIDRLGELPSNVSVRAELGEFEEMFDSLVDPIIQAGASTFAFIDPFGYSKSSMSVTGRLQKFPRCEVLYFLPMSFVYRFVGRPGQETALRSLFGTEEWRRAIDLQGQERTDYLLGLFERQLENGAGVEFVRSFQLRTLDGQDYRLVFSLGHVKGLELAKDAMWKVDPAAGTSYRAETDSGQEVLFSSGPIDTGPLLEELRNKFGSRVFSIEEAERVTLIDTPFRMGHLKQKTLAPAVKVGDLKVVQRTGPSGFKNAKLRFEP
jgi:three-Cys-motif partner protein